MQLPLASLGFGIIGFLCAQPAVRAQIQPEPGIQLSHKPATYSVSDVFFYGSLHGWVLAGKNGQAILFRTSDGGETWTPTATRKDLFRVFFLDSRIGWALTVDQPLADAARTSLYETRDGGLTWSQQSTVIASKPGHPDIITDFLFVDEEHGWFVGQGAEAGLFLETNDGGKSIHEVKSVFSGEQLYHIAAQGKDKLWAFRKDIILSSVDGGRSWKAQIDSNHPVDGATTILFTSGLVLSDGHGWAAGDGPAILATDDFGRTWRLVYQRDNDWFTDISFWDAKHGCAVGPSLLLDCTTDGGKTWTSRDVLPSKELHKHDVYERILFSSANRCWALAQGGFLFRSDDEGETWREVSFLTESKESQRLNAPFPVDSAKNH